MDTFPDYEWLPWKLEKGPQNYWVDMKNQIKFMDWAGKQLNIEKVNDWYQVSNQVTRYR
jgi:hypothetical protein